MSADSRRFVNRGCFMCPDPADPGYDSCTECRTAMQAEHVYTEVARQWWHTLQHRWQHIRTRKQEP